MKSSVITFPGSNCDRDMDVALTKFGFKNINRVEYKAVNIASLEMLASEKGITEFTIETFLENGLTSSNDLVKVLGRGELKSKVKVTAHGFSKAAIEAIEAQGGVCTKI